MDTYKMLCEQCEEIAHKLDKLAEYDLYFAREDDGYEVNYLDDYYDVKWILDHNKDYFACRICVAFGGPNIFIDTWEKCVCGYWGADEVKYPMTFAAVDAVDRVMEEQFRWR